MADAAAWASASPSHRDTLFKLAQYTCKLVASLGGDRELLQLARAINDSRTLMRVFGLLDVLRSLRTTAAAPSLALVQDCSLAIYHPIEAWYWLNTHAPGLARGPAWLSRAIAAISLVFNGGAAVHLTRRLSRLRKAAREAASQSAAALGREIARESGLVRLQLRKLVLDSVLLVNSLEHPTLHLRDWQVATIGVAATVFGLQAQWRAHAQACEQASALRLKAE
jgi:hypothetical protein